MCFCDALIVLLTESPGLASIYVYFSAIIAFLNVAAKQLEAALKVLSQVLTVKVWPELDEPVEELEIVRIHTPISDVFSDREFVISPTDHSFQDIMMTLDRHMKDIVKFFKK